MLTSMSQPSAELAFEPAAEREIVDVGLDDRQKTIGPERAHRAIVAGAAREARRPSP